MAYIQMAELECSNLSENTIFLNLLVFVTLPTAVSKYGLKVYTNTFKKSVTEKKHYA